MSVHSTAVVGKEVDLDTNVSIGPYCIITGKVKIGSGTKLDAHVTIGSETTIVEVGKNNHFLSNCVVGGPPQDVSYRGEPTRLIIGSNNVIREFVTINCGTQKGGGITRLGDHNMLMAYVHVAHDCLLENHVVVANSTQFAGHIEVGDHVKIGGMCGLVQFVKLGRHAYIGGSSHINKDILPYSIAEGSWAKSRATNKIGLDRSGYEKDEIENIHRALRFLLKGERTTEEAVAKIEEECRPSENLKYLIDFVRNSKNGVAK